MDLTYYPNIAAKANELGGVKKTLFNKKLLEEAERSWRQFSSEDIARIEQEAPSAVKVLTSFITPTAILNMNRNEHALRAIPVRDIIWIYGNVTTTRVNFIPTTKMHEVKVLTRSGETYLLGQVTTAAFTRKNPCGDAIGQIRELLTPYRKGIIYGWSEEAAEFIRSRFQEAVQMVDEKSAE